MAVPEAAERKAFALTIVGMSLLCAGLGTAAYFGYSRTQKMRTENAALNQDVESLKGKSNLLPKKRAELEKAEGEKNKYEELLPTGKEQIEDLFGRISTVATDTALEVVKSERVDEQAVFGGRQPEQKPYKEIAFTFEFRGTFHELARFISIIENYKTLKRFIAVSNLKIKAQSRGLVYDDGSQRHEFELKLTTYRYEEQKQGAGGGADPLATAPPAVVELYRKQGRTDDQIRAILRGETPPAAGVEANAEAAPAPVKKVPDIFADDFENKPSPEYQARKGGVYRIDPFTFAAGPEGVPLSEPLERVRKFAAEAQVKLKAEDFDGAASDCRKALALVDSAKGRPEEKLLASERPMLERLLAEATRRGRPEPQRERVRRLIAASAQALDAGAYDETMKKCRQARELIDKSGGLLEGERPAADQLYFTAERLDQRRQIAQEFARLSLRVSVLATTKEGHGSAAVINGRLVKEGDRLAVAQPRGGGARPAVVYVYRILPRSVVFLYRGVKFSKRVGFKKATAPKAP